LAKRPRLRELDPSTLEPSDQHIRGRTVVDDAFVRSVENVGVVQPLICRWEGDDDELRVVDGMRRATAAVRAGATRIPCLIYDLDDAEAAEVSFTLNGVDAWTTAVSERDEEAAMRAYLGGPRRPYKPYERDDELLDAKYDLGLASDTDLMLHRVGGADGVGRGTASALAQTFGHPKNIEDATVETLQQARGVGPTMAQTLREHLDDTADESMYVVSR
jgi:hypothetical protein